MSASGYLCSLTARRRVTVIRVTANETVVLATYGFGLHISVLRCCDAA